ncbi:hypothetical protein ACK3TF_000138 [Chlorella vulgaris]
MPLDGIGILSPSWATSSPIASRGLLVAPPPLHVAQGAAQQRGMARQRYYRVPPLATAAGWSGSSSGGVATGPMGVMPRRTVKVYEAGKQDSGKRIVAETVVQAPVDVVWRVLTSYERLATFVPNLESCERLPSPRSGKVWIRQRGCSQSVLWRLEAEAVIEVEEVRMPLGRSEARFTMVEGDFKELSGRWVVEPDPSSAASMATLLRFDITVQPKIALPSSVVSYVVRAGLPANIQAVCRRAEEITASKLRASGLARWAGEDDPPIPLPPSTPPSPPLAWEQEVAEEGAARAAASAVDQAARQQQQQAPVRDDGLPSKGPFWRLTGSTFPEAAPLTAQRQRKRQGSNKSSLQAEQEQVLRPLQQQQQQADPQSLYLGIVSVPLPPAGNRSSMQPQTQQELNQRQEMKEQLQAAYPAFGLRRPSGGRGNGSVPSASSPSSGVGFDASGQALPAKAVEVHLRRLDTFDTLHRRAVAAITIDAPPEAVWHVLTDYNRLAEFIPNLAVSQRIALPRNAPSNIIRVRQVGYKRMLYMCLHAETVLDLIEKPQRYAAVDAHALPERFAPSLRIADAFQALREIQFRQVAGDFQRFQGKWMLQGVPPSGGSNGRDLEPSGSMQTQLKYAVEIVIPRSTRMLGVLEPLLERTVFEDVPTNLAAVKQRVESMQAELTISELENAEMMDDFAVLMAELERCFGADKVLPARSELREMNRSDLEKAISAHGGPTAVSQQLGWKLKAKGRRPKGFWDAVDNVRAELDEFIEEHGLPAGIMPAKNDFVRAGRYDIARAVERWGGLYELADELGYAVSDSRRPGSSEWQAHISEVAATTGLSGREGLFELAAKTYAARRSMQGSIDCAEDDVMTGALSVDPLSTDRPCEPRSTAAGGTSDSAKQARGKPASMREEIDAW